MRILLVTLIAIFLAGCSGPSTLPVGLTARMDTPGASLDTAEALNIINQLRSSRGAPALRLDENLNAEARTLAGRYAGSGTAPKKPDNADAILVSAGYANFAETFSGWRSRETNVAELTDSAYSRVGLGVVYSANSTYGVHWVLLLAGAQ